MIRIIVLKYQFQTIGDGVDGVFQVYALVSSRIEDPILQQLEPNRHFAAWHEGLTMVNGGRLPLVARCLEDLAQRIFDHRHHADEYQFVLPDPPALPTGKVAIPLDVDEIDELDAAFEALIERRKAAGLL